MSDSLGLDGALDLTDATRVADRDHPGSPANLLRRAASAPADLAGDVRVPGLGATDGEDPDGGAPADE